MVGLAMVLLPDAFLGSVGAMVDSCTLVRDRFSNIVVEPGKSEPDLALTVLTPDGQPVTIGGGVRMRPDRPISSVDRFDFVWLPSFRIGQIETMRQRLETSRELIGWLRDLADAGATIGASGSAALFLVKARLLDGRTVPVSRAFMPTVRKLFPRCPADDRLPLADYGNILLSRGIGNDYAVIARAMSRTISFPSGRWLGTVTAIDHAEPSHLAEDPLVANAQMWIEQLYATDLSMAGLARQLATSQPTLARRFRKALGITPKAYAQQLRMAAAQGMLSGSTRPIDEIARFVGYSDVRIFREAFRRHTGETPGAWRRSRRKDEQEYS